MSMSNEYTVFVEKPCASEGCGKLVDSSRTHECVRVGAYTARFTYEHELGVVYCMIVDDGDNRSGWVWANRAA